MKSKLSTITLTAIILLSVLLTVNYFTGFGYYLPHRPMVIYEWETNDIFARCEPQYMTIPNKSSNTSITIYQRGDFDDGWYADNSSEEFDLRLKLEPPSEGDYTGNTSFADGGR